MAMQGVPTTPAGRLTPWQRYLLTIVACAATTLLATPLLGYLDLANIVMLFLLTVLLIAVTLGRGPAVLASILSVLLFDIFFVPPRFSLAVNNIQYLITFAVMLATALVTGQLAAGLKQRAQEALLREQRTRALYEVAARLAGALTLEQVVELTTDFVARQFAADCAILDTEISRIGAPSAGPAFRIDPHLAQTALTGNEKVQTAELSPDGHTSLYLPLRASMRTRGVLAVTLPDDGDGQPSAEIVALLEALASLIGICVERLHYVDVAQRTQINMVSERLRSSILSALSHDLRTPLTALVGLADSLSLVKPPLSDGALDTAQAIAEQAGRLAKLVENLLDMARLNAGTVTLRKEWQPLEEVVGASIKLLGSALHRHPVKVSLPRDLPLLEFDAVLLERVFCNLLENAAKYSPDDTPISIQASERNNHVLVQIIDAGKGFPTAPGADLFDMFVRGQAVSGKPGAGLGLAICRAIVEAHDGHIYAENRADGGCVCFSLPKGVPPVLEAEVA